MNEEGCVVISFRVILETVLSYLVRIEEEIRRIRLREFACPLDTNRIVKIIDKSEEIDSFRSLAGMFKRKEN